MAISLMEGNEAIAWGAFEAGCRFYAGYPITPATTIFNTMLRLLPPAGGICIQGEDEIASIGSCLGASMAGLKVMTATSGPGLSLYSEHISFAIGSEIPIVITVVQRLGPSTGSATRGADGDIQFMRWGNSGGLPIIALAPSDVRDCFVLTIHAFNLAEEFRCPVFVASNKEVSMTKEGVDIKAVERPGIIDRATPPSGVPFLPFDVAPSRSVPYFLPIGSDFPVRQTSSTHGPDGYITTDPGQIARNQARLRVKLLSAVERFSFHEAFLEKGADTLVLTYGVTARAAKDVYQKFKQTASPVSLLVLKTLWPVPETLIREKAREAKRVIVLEMNDGQYVREVRRILPEKQVDFYGKMNGKLLTPLEIQEVISND
ncbi:MAG: pyruvate flavodoxin/ferredoxin oxidoreductase [Deltaproteobacteria bacterium]|nr:MAG: pyruvate flavodoxin/ferredoxin oxidoreductase [Deltaproteobacteria bacterium]